MNRNQAVGQHGVERSKYISSGAWSVRPVNSRRQDRTKNWSEHQIPQVASMSLSSFFSSFLNVVHADAEEKEEVVESTQTEGVEQAEEEAEDPEDVRAIHTTCSVSPLMLLLVSCTQ